MIIGLLSNSSGYLAYNIAFLYFFIKWNATDASVHYILAEDF